MTAEPGAEMLPEHVRALLSPESYEHPVQDIRLVQTHISYVILAGSYVYKLRKAVDLGFLDFRDLDVRKRDCAEEIRLNSRICSNLYLGVLAVTRERGRYRFGGPGPVVDYAVQMRRLPDDRMMPALLSAGAVDFDMIGRLVTRLARFHGSADGSKRVREAGGYRVLVENWASNLKEISALLDGTLTREQFHAVRRYADEFLHDNRALFARREDEGRVRDCHGDLRADAICFDAASPDGICIFDCLEFDERLRFSDTGLDICFLAMDLERRGFTDLSDILLSLYTSAMGDSTLPLVSRLYRCYRAVIRGKVSSILAAQEEVPSGVRREALTEAGLHFELAESYARPNASPRVVMVMGLSGSGKSVLAGALAHRIGTALLSTDIVRKEMAGALPLQRRRAPIGADLYSPAMTQRAYDEIARQAALLLEDGRAVIVDGTYIEANLRAPMIEVARARGLPFLAVECAAPEALIRQRQEHRASEPWTASDATWEVYLHQKARYEPPAELAPASRLQIDTSRPLSEQLEETLARLGEET